MDIIFLKKCLGYFAAFCTTIAFLPQAFKVWKSNNTKDISLHMFMIFTIGVFSWLIYGILIKDFPIIISNSFTLIFSIFILYYILKNK
ncbi:SemiSWEET transporter [Rickettsiales bacterium]|nr:SemiSWEET transporter [Rickettsiales bacterium]